MLVSQLVPHTLVSRIRVESGLSLPKLVLYLAPDDFIIFKYSLLLIIVKNVTGCELVASCHPAKTMQNDVYGSVPEVIRHEVTVGSVHRSLFILLQQVLLIGCWQVDFNE